MSSSVLRYCMSSSLLLQSIFAQESTSRTEQRITNYPTNNAEELAEHKKYPLLPPTMVEVPGEELFCLTAAVSNYVQSLPHMQFDFVRGCFSNTPHRALFNTVSGRAVDAEDELY